MMKCYWIATVVLVAALGTAQTDAAPHSPNFSRMSARLRHVCPKAVAAPYIKVYGDYRAVLEEDETGELEYQFMQYLTSGPELFWSAELSSACLVALADNSMDLLRYRRDVRTDADLARSDNFSLLRMQYLKWMLLPGRQGDVQLARAARDVRHSLAKDFAAKRQDDAAVWATFADQIDQLCPRADTQHDRDILVEEALAVVEAWLKVAPQSRALLHEAVSLYRKKGLWERNAQRVLPPVRNRALATLRTLADRNVEAALMAAELADSFGDAKEVATQLEWIAGHEAAATLLCKDVTSVADLSGLHSDYHDLLVYLEQQGEPGKAYVRRVCHL